MLGTKDSVAAVIHGAPVRKAFTAHWLQGDDERRDAELNLPSEYRVGKPRN